MVKVYKYHAAYIDREFRKHEIEIESTAIYTERRRWFTNECARNNWEFIYFRRVD